MSVPSTPHTTPLVGQVLVQVLETSLLIDSLKSLRLKQATNERARRPQRGHDVAGNQCASFGQ
jgi:hypothetical protein